MSDQDDALKEKVLLCRQSGPLREEILAELAARAYRFAGRRRGAGEDDPGEFLLFMYPRLERLIDRYRDAGVPFEHYLNSVLAWNLRSYHKRARGLELKWQAGRVADLWPDNGGDEAPGEANAEGAGGTPLAQLAVVPPLEKRADRKRFLLLVLRNCWRLGPERLEHAARIACVPAAWLAETAETLRGALAPRVRRLERLRCRRNGAYARMRLLEERRERAADPQERRRLDRAISREAAGWRRACDLIRSVPLEPTHRRIAGELGMPRGTVDTCLRAARQRGAGLLQSEVIRYA